MNLTRICLIVAILGALATATVNMVKVKTGIVDLTADRDHEKQMKEDTQQKLARTNKVLVATIAELNSTKEELATTKDQRDKAVATADEQTKKASQLSEALSKTTEERDGARNELAAWKALGIPMDQIKATIASLKTVTEAKEALEAEKKILAANNEKLQNRLSLLLNPDYKVELPENLKGKVLVADPKYDFVVLDVGQNQGAKEEGQLLVNRDGKLVAKVKIKSVQPDRSIANVMPGWKLSDVMEGDQVLP